MLRLYDMLDSGNGYKVRLLLTLLQIPFERVEMSVPVGATRTPAFLAKNPAGKIPALELEDSTVLAESGAILWFLADGTRFLPDDRLSRIDTLRWMFFEQNAHETNVAEARFILHHPEHNQHRMHLVEEKQRRGYAALDVMERHLQANAYFVAGRYTIADIALYAYTHVAPEGGFDLGRYPAIQAWIARVASEPGHIPITQG